MNRNALLRRLDQLVGNDLQVRRYNLSDMISESYKTLYDCEQGTNLQKLVESHLNDVRKHPTEIDRLSRQLSIIKEVSRMVESKELSDKDLDTAVRSKIDGELKEETLGDGRFQIVDKDGEVVDSYTDKKDAEDWVEQLYKDNEFKRGDLKVVDTRNNESAEPEDEEEDDLLEDTELTDEEIEELTKHLSEIRKNKKNEGCHESEGLDEGEDCPECSEEEDSEVEESTDATESEKVEEANINGETPRYAVIKPDGKYAGSFCTSYEEAKDLAAQEEGRIIFKLVDEEENEEFFEESSVSDDSEESCNLKTTVTESNKYKGLENFSKNSSSKPFYKTFKKMHEALVEGKALTRQESMNLYKAANSAMTQLSIELEHNPEFITTFNECTSLLSEDVAKLLESMKKEKAPSKATMKSLAKFSEALLLESDDEDEEEEEDIPDDEEIPATETEEEETSEDEEFVGDDEGSIDSEESEEFDQEYADARLTLHLDMAEEYEGSEDPEVQEKITLDAEEVSELPGLSDEQKAQLDAAEGDFSGEEELPIEDEPTEEEEESVEEKKPESDDLSLGDDEEITDDELAELKRHLTEIRKARKL